LAFLCFDLGTSAINMACRCGKRKNYLEPQRIIYNRRMDEASFKAVIQSVATGVSISQALLTLGVPRWAYYNYLRENPIAQQAHARARIDCAHSVVDNILQAAETELDPQRMRAKTDAYTKYASLVNPREYGAKIDLTVSRGEDPAALYAEGMQRLRSMRDQQQAIESQATEPARLIDARPTDTQSDVDPFS
jgi:hypothetical protein